MTSIKPFKIPVPKIRKGMTRKEIDAAIRKSWETVGLDDRINFGNRDRMSKAKTPGELLNLELECPVCSTEKSSFRMFSNAYRVPRMKFSTVIFRCLKCNNDYTVTKIPVKICKTCKTDLTFK